MSIVAPGASVSGSAGGLTSLNAPKDWMRRSDRIYVALAVAFVNVTVRVTRVSIAIVPNWNCSGAEVRRSASDAYVTLVRFPARSVMTTVAPADAVGSIGP